MPERNDVFIVPQSACTEGADTARYYTNSNIVGCFILKAPVDHSLPMIEEVGMQTMDSATFFDQIDTNGDGKLDRDELLAGLKAKGLEEWQIDGLHKALDIDKDGVISKAEWTRADSGWAKCTALGFGKHGQMAGMHMIALAADARFSDRLDETHGFPPRVMEFTARVAQPPTTDPLALLDDAVALHRMIEKDFGGKTHWLENVARFEPGEMAAAMEALQLQLLHAYTTAYVYTSREEASKVCSNMGILAQKGTNGMFNLTVSLCSPAELGWKKNAGGEFRQNAAKSMNMTPNDVQAVIICAIPIRILQAAGCTWLDNMKPDTHRKMIKTEKDLEVWRQTPSAELEACAEKVCSCPLY